MNRKISNVFVMVVAALAIVLAGCKGAADLTKVKAQAFELVGKYGPQVSGLLGKVADLSGKASAIPDSVPGKAKVLELIASQKGTIAKLKATLDGYAGTIDKAARTGKKAEVEKASAAFASTMDAGVAEANVGIEDAGKQVTVLEEEARAAAAPDGTDVAIKLDGGVELKGAATGVEKQLVDFLADATKVVDKTTWFNFDRLAFASGKAELDLGVSKAQLDNVAAILAAFPKATLKIGGYTDNVGDAKANQKVSQQRADAVKAALVADGVVAARLEAEGFGPQFPVCATNDTDACRAQNRRIALRVTAK